MDMNKVLSEGIIDTSRTSVYVSRNNTSVRMVIRLTPPYHMIAITYSEYFDGSLTSVLLTDSAIGSSQLSNFHGSSVHGQARIYGQKCVDSAIASDYST